MVQNPVIRNGSKGDHRMPRNTALAALALAAGLAAPPALAQTPIGSLSSGSVTIEGTVTDVFGNRFVLQDRSGRILVEAGPTRHQRLSLQTGERLRVVGKPDDGGFAAFTIRREDGSEIVIRSAGGPPPWAGRGGPGRERERDRDRDRRTEAPGANVALAAATAAGYRPEGQPELHRRHYEVTALNRRGERVRLHVDFDGRIYRETWDRGRGFGARPSEQEARRMAEAAGFTIQGPLEPHPRHFEAAATSQDGRRVTLHLHADGIRRVETRR
jgi:hypothetical protein